MPLQSSGQIAASDIIAEFESRLPSTTNVNKLHGLDFTGYQIISLSW